MRARLLLLSILVVIAAGSASSPGAERGRVFPGVPSGVKALRDIEYDRVGEKKLLLDLYLPEEKPDKALPVIVWIHGGAWLAGDKKNCPAVGLATRGYAVASINYRLSQKAVFPAQIHDCKSAIRWVRANAAKYGMDADRIGVWGRSAGGHLVALLGTSGEVDELEGEGGNLEQSSRVQAVCDFFGPTNFLSAQASPVTHVSKDDPPFLIMHGDRDRVVPLEQSKILHEALKKAGVESTFHVVEGAGHGFGGRGIMEMVQAFFNKHLKDSAESKPEVSSDKE
jgi:acetyl esterase/lipase